MEGSRGRLLRRSARFVCCCYITRVIEQHANLVVPFRIMPCCRKLELFARQHNVRPGYLSLGDEIESTVPQKLIDDAMAQLQSSDRIGVARKPRERPLQQRASVGDGAKTNKLENKEVAKCGKKPGKRLRADSEEEESSDSDLEVDEVKEYDPTRSSAPFLVSWSGYGSDEDTWEPLVNLIGEEPRQQALALQKASKRSATSRRKP